ncbi:hypothetical protein [Sphingorhabdus sp. YGSMI21]|uniref:hypothetical protein n=1 Tax=Sphingorhabdus sp. YGSMI21 TaxID=2077182 RepID=UPI000C1F446A|nr:hypothetical protein [Sphingorhabdus sp. YGSMI21]ATW04812.1 hypothetical protein CHN51_15670 [Sphingorhabdus sp. YGSMI21]
MIKIERKILVGACLALILANLCWYSFDRDNDQSADVQLGTTIAALSFSDKASIDKLPYYDRAQTAWIKDSAVVKDITTELVDDDPQNLGPDSVGKYVVVRLERETGSTAYIETIKALASRGICLVALVDATNPRQEEGVFWADISRIIRVKNARGQSVNCHDRFNT